MDIPTQFLILYFTILTVLLQCVAADDTSPPGYTYTPTDHILLNCGSSSDQTSPDGRTWEADANSKFAPNLSDNTTSASTPSVHDPSLSDHPYYSSARIFHSDFTYTFPLSPGPKFLRLYFYPQTYSGLDQSRSFFSLAAGPYTLLRNFSASLTAPTIYPPQSAFFKEYIVSSGDDPVLNLTFIPLPSSYAFVNAIEIVSIPENLYTRDDGDVDGYIFVGYSTQFHFSGTTSLETVYRLNVGGADVTADRDTGMFRVWQQDSAPFVFNGGVIPVGSNLTVRYAEKSTPNYTAPATVYQTSRVMGPNHLVNLNVNLSWCFPVDSGFNYLVRLHFCETQPEMTQKNDRVFVIYINNQTADPQADVIYMAGGNGIPTHQDYVVSVPSGNQDRRDLWVALHPSITPKNTPKYNDAILNGVEVFKLNSTSGSLAGKNPAPIGVDLHPPGRKPTGNPKKSSLPVISGVSGGVVGVAVLALLCFLIFRRRNRKSRYSDEDSLWGPFSTSKTKSTKSRGSSLPSDLCRHFSIAEIKTATNNFDPVLIVGAGGFGNVYRGCIDGGTTAVAIKRLNPGSQQGAHEFVTEIEMLSRLRHLHLVPLIGYSVDNNEMILVYAYMSRGTLRDHICSTENPPLPWNQRLEICIGAAQGLEYLHTGAKHMIIHRDVKTTNILLDEKWVAKVSDFGLSRVGPTGESKAHVSTAVKGSFGYLDPEYCRFQQLTEKSDVYSFGVVLCEVICGKPPLIRTAGGRQVSLAEWVRICYEKNGSLDEIVDRSLKGKIAPECLKKYGEVAMSCLRGNGIERPSMSDVVWDLKFVLELQCTAEKGIKVVGPINGVNDEVEILLEDKWSDESFTTETRSGTEMSSGQSMSVKSSESGALLSTNGVFSEIMNPKAR